MFLIMFCCSMTQSFYFLLASASNILTVMLLLLTVHLVFIPAIPFSILWLLSLLITSTLHYGSSSFFMCEVGGIGATGYFSSALISLFWSSFLYILFPFILLLGVGLLCVDDFGVIMINLRGIIPYFYN